MEANPIQAVTDIFSAGNILTAVLLVALAWSINRILGWLFRALANRFVRYRMQITGLFPVTRILVWATTTYIIVVDVFNPEQSQLLALLASVGLAVGLASQDVIRNVISGILILFQKPFRVGDMVRVGEHYGEILSIGLHSVELRTFDDSTVVIPNSSITGQSISNSNSGALDEMVVVSFNVPASLDVQQIKDLAWESAASSPYVYLKKPITVMVGDSFNRTFLTTYTVKAYVLDVRLEKLFASDIIERVKKVLLDQKLLTPELVVSALTHLPED